MSAPDPLVSIITPTFNRAGYIGETIDSILAQDYPRIEHIVVDDGSGDGTRELLACYGNKIRVIAQANQGEPVAVNRGFSAAGGEIIGVVNDDDPVERTLVSEMVAAFRDNPDALVVYPDWYIIDSEGKRFQDISVTDYDYRDMIRWHQCMPGPGSFFHRRALELELGRDENFRLVGDFEFWVRVGLHGEFVHLPRPLASWRYHEAATSVTDKSVAMAKEHLAILRKLFARRDLPESVRALKREAYASAYYIAGLKTRDSRPGFARRQFLMTLLLSPGYLKRLPPNFRGTAPMATRTLLGRKDPES
jgi:glycosyltransferase involved in cell wall biosynthesis